MKTLITTISMFLLANVVFAGIECYKTKEECWRGSAQLSIEEQSRFYCFVDPNPEQCVIDKKAEQQIRETAKYKTRNGNKLPPANYFDEGTSTENIGGIKTQNNSDFLATGIALIIPGIGLLALIYWLFVRKK